MTTIDKSMTVTALLEELDAWTPGQVENGKQIEVLLGQILRAAERHYDACDWGVREAGIRTRLTTIRDTDPSYLTDAAE